MTKPALPSTSRKAALALVLALIVASFGLGRLQTNPDYHVYFPGDDPLVLEEQQLNALFALGDSLLLIVEADTPQALVDARARTAYKSLNDDLLALDAVSDVRGFHELLDSDDDPFAAGDSLSEPTARLYQHPRADLLLSSDRRFGLMEVAIDLPAKERAEALTSTMARIRTLVDTHLLAPGLVNDSYYGGVIALNEAYITVVRQDLLRFVPGLLLVMALILFAALRRLRIVALCIGGGLLSASAAMGVAGWLGWSLAAINAFTPIIVLSLFIAAAMHLVLNWLQGVASHGDSALAAEDSLAFNRQPLLLSAASTAVGFSLLVLSPSPPIQIMGITIALGTLFSWLQCRFLLPTLLAYLSPGRQAAAASCQRLSVAPLGRWLAGHSNRLLGVWAVLAISALTMLPGASINDNVYRYFAGDSGFGRAIGVLDREFKGCIRLSYGLPGDALSETHQHRQGGLDDWLSGQPEVRRFDGVYRLLDGLGVSLEQAARLTDEQSLASLGVRQDVGPELAFTRASVFLNAMDSRSLLAFNQRVQTWLAQDGQDFIGGISPDLVFADLNLRNAHSMFWSLAIALLAISIFFALVTRSLRLGAVGLLCNFMPLLLVYGLWFGNGGTISLGAAVVMGMIMGVIVDDTIHILLKYHYFKQQGRDAALSKLTTQVFPAIVLTSVTLAAGLIIGALSGFRPIHELAMLSAGVILVAMLVDLVLLPALLARGERSHVS